MKKLILDILPLFNLQKERIHFYFFLLVILTGSTMRAQHTINLGELTVLPGTRMSTVLDFHNQGVFINDGETYFYGGIHNDSIIDFVERDGISILRGTRDQEISGRGSTVFNQLELDNASDRAPFKLHSEITIENHLRFRRGVLDNRNHGGTINFEWDATHSGAANRSFVLGAADKMGDQGFVFPTGDRGHYRYARISAGGQDAKHYKGKYFFENSDVLFPHRQKMNIIKAINDKEYWTIAPIDQAGDRLVTLSWDDATTPQIMLDNVDNLRIIRWDEKEQMWIDEGGTSNPEDRTVTSAVSGYGVVTLGFVDYDTDLPCDISIYNGISPNGDGRNDSFTVWRDPAGDCIDRLGMKIFNRWGVLVYESDDYGVDGDAFRGYSQGRATVGGAGLPTGTYFYVMDMEYTRTDGSPGRFEKSGYLYINSN